MATYGVPQQPASRLRRVVFSVVGGVVSLAFLASTPNLLAPWRVVNIENLADPAHVRWSLALEGVVDLVGIACVIGALARPARSALLVQYVLCAAILALAVIMPFNPMFVVTGLVLLLVPATYPYQGQLFSLASHRGPSRALLAVSVAAAAALLPIAVHALTVQIALPRGTGSDFNVLATNAEHLVLLALGGLLAATRRPGWKVLALCVTGAYVYLGLASMLLPDQPNSWGVAGGAMSLLAAGCFGLSTAMAARRVDVHAAESQQVAARGL